MEKVNSSGTSSDLNLEEEGTLEKVQKKSDLIRTSHHSDQRKTKIDNLRVWCNDVRWSQLHQSGLNKSCQDIKIIDGGDKDK